MAFRFCWGWVHFSYAQPRLPLWLCNKFQCQGQATEPNADNVISPPLCVFANQKRYKHLTRDTHIKYAFGCISFFNFFSMQWFVCVLNIYECRIYLCGLFRFDGPASKSISNSKVDKQREAANIELCSFFIMAFIPFFEKIKN